MASQPKNEGERRPSADGESGESGESAANAAAVPEVVIVGAGAAGLWAAAAIGRAGRRALLLEKTPRTGSKILASGGTRCNLTTTLGPREAAALFGSPASVRFVTKAFLALAPAAVRARFDALGVPTVTEVGLEKVFPASQRAVDVRDALERDARAHGARVRVDAPVTAIEPIDEGRAGWRVHVAGDAEPTFAAHLVLCPGGMSYPRTGTTGDGYGWLAALGLALVEPVPALVPLTSPAAWARELTGIAVQEAEARLLDAQGVERARRRRPVLFTHQGLSGPGAMDLSHVVARAAREAERRGAPSPRFDVVVDLLPHLAREALRDRLLRAAAEPGATRLARVVPELPRRLLAACCRQAGLGEANPPVDGLPRAARHALIEALRGLCVPVDGTLGFDKAEVTAGGLALDEVCPRTYRVRRFENLYVVGELLDLQGPIGGLSFQLAFASAELAARSIAAAR